MQRPSRMFRHFYSVQSKRTSHRQHSTRIWVTISTSGRPLTLRRKLWTPYHIVIVAQKTLSPLFYHFNIFWGDICFNWNCCASGLYALDQFEGAACVNITQDFPDDGAPRVPEHAQRKLCIDYIYFLLHEVLIRYVEFDIRHGKGKIMRH